MTLQEEGKKIWDLQPDYHSINIQWFSNISLITLSSPKLKVLEQTIICKGGNKSRLDVELTMDCDPFGTKLNTDL